MSRAGFLRLAATVLLMGMLWLALDGGEALSRLGSAETGWLLAGLLALTAQTLISAARWRLLAAWQGVRLRPRQAVAEYYLSQLVNQALPGGMVGDVGRALRSADAAGLVPAGKAVVLDRLAGNAMLLAVLVIAAAAVAILPGNQGLPEALPGQVLAGLGVVTCGLLAVALLVRRAAGRATPPDRMASRLGRIRQALAVGRLTPGLLPRLTALSLGTVLANLAAFDFAARATGTALPPAAALVLLPLILGAMLLPLSVAGWGLREGAAAALFPLAGFSAEAGLAASIAFGLLFLVASLPGLFVMLCPRRRNAKAPEGLNPVGGTVEHP